MVWQPLISKGFSLLTGLPLWSGGEGDRKADPTGGRQAGSLADPFLMRIRILANVVRYIRRLNMEVPRVDLQSLFGLHVT